MQLWSFMLIIFPCCFSLLSGALVACLKRMSVESWPDLSVQSKFFFLSKDMHNSLFRNLWYSLKEQSKHTLISCQCFLKAIF